MVKWLNFLKCLKGPVWCRNVMRDDKRQGLDNIDVFKRLYGCALKKFCIIWHSFWYATFKATWVKWLIIHLWVVIVSIIRTYIIRVYQVGIARDQICHLALKLTRSGSCSGTRWAAWLCQSHQQSIEQESRLLKDRRLLWR